ncbi:MAG: glycoside hydrolase [Prosthecobacter sp.]|nr:glycoside hydrolase [Prosthecobacter sp.]
MSQLTTSSRRTFLSHSLQAGAVMAAPWAAKAADPEIKILETKVISRQPEFYHGWPTVARRKNGELWVVWSGGREEHVCPFGQVVSMCSRDDGASWTRARVLHDSPMDDRDSGVLETAKGTLLVTTFTSLAYEPYLEKESKFAALTEKGWSTEKMPAGEYEMWKATRDFLTPEQRQAGLGEWILRSTDGGISWSAPIPSVVNSPHGPIQLQDGRLLYAGKQLWTGEKKIGVAESKDDGLTWQWLAEIPTRTGDTVVKGYHELHAVEAADGTLIVQIRNHNDANKGETLQTVSKDGGKTWSEPKTTGVYGLPSHLLRLRDGRLMMTYGHRRKPYGNQARLSSDNGQTWGEALIISGDGKGGDLGYPSTVELADGSFLSVWYESMKEPKKAVLRQAHWTLG